MSRLDMSDEVLPMATLSRQQARNLHLAVQGLLRPPRARASRARLVAAIQRMRLLQIDTINIVARSPYLVLFSRLGAYDMRWLDEALVRGKVFECWAHEACFAPMSDYGLHAAQRHARSHHWAYKNAQRMHREHRRGMDAMLAHIREHGPVKASHFQRKRKGGAGWWGWKDEKRWLEAWFALGELMIARRENFQRVYDLRERVLSGASELPAEMPAQQARQEMIVGGVRALGIAQAGWIADYFRTGRKHKDTDMEPFVRSGELLRVAVRGWKAVGYVHRENLALLQRAQRGALRATHTTLLSPFDPVVWDRARASAMFDFDYRIECYTPAHKRRYGYFVLPILHRGRLVGRVDAKAHRGDGMFEVKSIYLEDNVEVTPQLSNDVALALRTLADWHETLRVVVRRSEPEDFKKRLCAACNSRDSDVR